MVPLESPQKTTRNKVDYGNDRRKPATDRRKSKPVTPRFLFLIVAGTIFVVEAGIMLGLGGWFPSHSILQEALVDALLLIAILIPVLYYSLYRPIQRALKTGDDAVKSLELAAAVFENAQEGIMISDQRGIILNVNPAFSKITGYSKTEIVGESPRLLKSGRHDASFYQRMWNHLTTTGHWEGEIWNRTKQGEIYPESISISAVLDQSDAIDHYVAVFSQAYIDRLTGLQNRHSLMGKLEQRIQDRKNTEPFALCFIDLDGFKAVNDNFGHEAGDKVLRQFAEMSDLEENEDIRMFRFGGDEFVGIIEPYVNRSHIERKVQQLCAQVKKKFQHYQITASIGIAIFPGDGTSAQEIIKAADTAMYSAKNSGKNKFCFYTEDVSFPVG